MDIPHALGFGMQKDEQVTLFFSVYLSSYQKVGNNSARGTTQEQVGRLLWNIPLIYISGNNFVFVFLYLYLCFELCWSCKNCFNILFVHIAIFGVLKPSLDNLRFVNLLEYYFSVMKIWDLCGLHVWCW